MEIDYVGSNGAFLMGGDLNIPGMLAPDGRDPSLPNGLSEDKHGTIWILKRTKELVALHDNPVYSFFSGVEVMANQPTRTTHLSGTAAVAELFSGTPHDFFHKMPGTLNDRERDNSENGIIEADIIRKADITTKTDLARFAAASKQPKSVLRPSTNQDDLPRVGKIGANPDPRREHGQPDFATVVGSEQITPGGPGWTGRVVADRATVETNPSLLMQTARLLPDGRYSVDARNPTLSVRVVMPDGKVKYDHNVEDGDAVMARRLVEGKQLSDADERVWRTIYTKEQVGNKRVKGDPVAIRSRQRQQIEEFAMNTEDRAHLHWKLLPEHLRVLFLTPEARMALEHALWFAHFQISWDGNAPPPMRQDGGQGQRAMVPAIDLMTHAMVRVPFQSLVANLLLYWRYRRTADVTRADYALSAINGIINTLRTMRYSSNGFLSLMGHYDVAAQQSRYDLELARNTEFQETGKYKSDMDLVVYPDASRPGGIGTYKSDRGLITSSGVSLPASTGKYMARLMTPSMETQFPRFHVSPMNF